MEENRILISTDSTSDLTREDRERFGISVMYGYVITEEGRYRDPSEVNSDNLVEYMEEEGKEAFSDIASIEEYKEYFGELKKRTKGSIIHISMAHHVSNAYNVALEAAADMENVFVVDSRQISGGLGLVVLKAADLALRGASLTLLLDEIQKKGEQTFCSFIAETTRYLYKNGKVKKGVHRLCRIFGIHPILKMSGGRLGLGGMGFGNKNGFVRRYIRWALRHPKQIDTDMAYLIADGYSYEYLEYVKEEVRHRVRFRKIVVNDASASVASNCGPGAIGILYVRK